MTSISFLVPIVTLTFLPLSSLRLLLTTLEVLVTTPTTPTSPGTVLLDTHIVILKFGRVEDDKSIQGERRKTSRNLSTPTRENFRLL